MNADKKNEFLYPEETHAIIGCAFEVLSEIGHGLHEKIYENALVVEFGLRGIPYTQLSKDHRP
jgi:GxxExxY protein